MKSVFVDIVGYPRSDKNFDDRIFLEKISKTYTIKKITTNQRFSNDILINSDIKSRKWRVIYAPDSRMTCDNLEQIIGNMCELEDFIIDRLECSHKYIIGNNRNTKYIRIDNYDELIYNKHLKQSEIILEERYQKHDTFDKDYSYDSEYILCNT